MIPTVLLKLIHLYNEKGSVLLSANNEKVYWTNGKRFEFWCNFEHRFVNYVIKCNNHIFAIQHNLKSIFMMKLGKWIFYDGKFVDSLARKLRLGKHETRLRINSQIWYYRLCAVNLYRQMSNTIWKLLDEILTIYVSSFIIGLHDTVYVFDDTGFKFNHFKKEITFINIPKNRTLANVVLINNLFYMIYLDQTISIYNPELNHFQDITLLLP